MPLSRSRDYLSIGEVLESVRSDFPDISISRSGSSRRRPDHSGAHTVGL